MSKTATIRTPLGEKVYVWRDGALLDVELLPPEDTLAPIPLPSEVMEFIRALEEDCQRLTGCPPPLYGSPAKSME